MGKYIYVDNSNVWIEGMRWSAVDKGMVPDIFFAMQNKIFDQSWRIDFGKLYNFIGGDIQGAYLYGSRPPKNDSLWNLARGAGFEPKVFDRNLANREKKVDSSMVTNIIGDSYTIPFNTDTEVVLVAGDSDYVPIVENLAGRGIPINVYFWSNAAIELKTLASRFVELNPYLDSLQY